MIRHPAVVIWAFLFGATCMSWFLVGNTAGNRALSTIGIIIIALIKIRLVITHFMEIRYAPLLLQWMFDAWLLIVGVAMIGCYLFLR